jgi:hypothetical protein
MDEMGNEYVQIAEPISISTETITSVNSGNDGYATSSNIEQLDPQVVNTKGSPRMLIIMEAVKKYRFYTCSHCGSIEHIIKNCPNKHIHYDHHVVQQQHQKRNGFALFIGRCYFQCSLNWLFTYPIVLLNATLVYLIFSRM